MVLLFEPVISLVDEVKGAVLEYYAKKFHNESIYDCHWVEEGSNNLIHNNI